MTTVTAKALRDNLSKYLDRIERGEEIIIIRNSEIIGSLRPAKNSIKSNDQAIATMLDQNKEFFVANSKLTEDNTPIKELYHQALEKNMAYETSLCRRECITRVFVKPTIC